MFDWCRPFGRLFLLLLLVLGASVSQAQTLPTTLISDVVYRADGSPAGGTLLISWPEFTTNAGQAVAAGNKNTVLGTGGVLAVSLVPNINAAPANTVYTVVYQLNDDTVKTEYWIVPTVSPTTLSVVRTILGATNSASQMATQQYVNNALAGKANDAAVVHLAGTETIAGAKQFAVAPGLPTPTHPGDATNKLYVDNAVQNVGSGSFVSKAGDTMSGPLTLSGDPAAPGQATTKRYVDIGVSAKADLNAGLVPTGELGAGTVNGSLCLRGDSTWGACGSSSNAVSIQNVPVDTTTPADNQVITYVASQGKYEPKPGGGLTAGMQAVKYSPDFGWTQSPATDLSSSGAKTVNLAVCAPGVTGTEPWYYVYVTGTGTEEAVLVTGGTCAGNGQAGTLQFTTVNSHAAGYAITSASSGLQEALIAARFSPTNPPGPSQSGKVIAPPGELQLYARVSVRASNLTVDFSGSILNCYMSDTCIFAGDPANSIAFLDITLLNPRGRPMVVSGQSPFIEVNAQKTRLLNVATRIPPTGGTFSSYVQVDNDQSFLLDGLDTALATGSSDYGVLCNASVCNPVVYAPGPFGTNAAVGWLKNLNISMQCTGNGVDWQSGNTLRISDSVIQGFAQYGVRAGVKRGGFNGFELDNVYEEVGSCANPLGAIGQAGVIAQGATVKVVGGVSPSGAVPQFANTGSTDYRYYIVANSATLGASNPLYAGRALTSGTGNITVTTPDVPGANTLDLLRVTWLPTNNPREQAPFGTGNYAVAIGVTRSSVCANGVCTFTDTQAALQSYAVAIPIYFPLLDYWPGNLVLAANKDSGSALDVATAWMDNAPSNIVGEQGLWAPAVIASNCSAIAGWTPVWLSCYTSMAPGVFPEQGALLLAPKTNFDGGLRTNLKGRLNFPTLGTAPGHIITLSDSNFQKTIATANNRPSSDANDAFIGYDQGDRNPAHIGISLGAPVSISDYIGNTGDGTNWLERLTSGLKEFKTNVQLDSTLTVAGTAQASALLTTGAGTWAVQGSFGTLSPALTGKSAIGFGVGGKLQVSENAGSVVEVAKLDAGGNVSENANTATQLAQTPVQCNGSFATGIQANGNANCSIADVIQLAETGQPTGTPNYGIFWFDATCHCPKVISNNGQAVQLGLVNVFNPDANTLEEYNGTSPQALSVYGTRTDASNYERLRMGYDTTDGYFLLGAEAAGTGTQRGLGLWMQGSLRWVVDSSFNFKPWSDNVKDVGTPTLRLKHLYTGTYLDMTGGAAVTDVSNASTTGTTLNKLAKLAGAPVTATLALTSDAGGVIGVVVDGAGTTGNAQIARTGEASCVFDGPTTSGDYVQISSTTAGDCHDAGASYPGTGQVLGRVLSTNASAGTYAVLVAGAEVQGSMSATSSTQGYAMTGTGGSLGASALFVDASQFSGSDVCAKIVAARASASCVGVNACKVVAPFAGQFNCAASPFTSWGNGGVLDLSASGITDIRISAPIQVPNGVHLVGSGPSSPTTSASGTANDKSFVNYHGTIIRACNPKIFNCSPAFAVPTEAVTGGISVSGTTATVTVNNTLGNGQDVVIMSGAGPFSGYHSFVISTIGACTPTCTGFTVPVASGTSSCSGACSGATVYEGTPLIALGGISAAKSYGVEVDHLTADCAFIIGCIPFANSTAEEHSSWHDVTATNGGATWFRITQQGTAYGGTGADVGGANNSGPYMDMIGQLLPESCELTSGASNCFSDVGTGAKVDETTTHVNPQGINPLTCDTIGVSIDGTSAAANKLKLDQFSSFTMSASDPHNTGNVPVAMNKTTCGNEYSGRAPMGIIVAGFDARVADFHLEYWLGNSQIGGNIAVNPEFPGASTQNVTFTNFEICCGGDSNAYAVDIGGTNPVANSGVWNWSYLTQTEMIKDNQTGNLCNGGESTEGYYLLGNNTSQVLTTCTGVNNSLNGVAALSSPAFTGAPVAPTPSTSDNSTKIATTAYVQAQGYLTTTPTCPIWFTQAHASSTVSFSATANKASLWGVVLYCTLATTQITYDIATADNTANTYDIGLVNSSGTVVAHIGSTAGTAFAPSTGWKTLSWTTSTTLPPGKYYVAITSSCTSSCAVLEAGSSGVGLTFAGNQAVTITAGGTLPASVTTPSDAYTASTIPAWSVH